MSKNAIILFMFIAIGILLYRDYQEEREVSKLRNFRSAILGVSKSPQSDVILAKQRSRKVPVTESQATVSGNLIPSPRDVDNAEKGPEGRLSMSDVWLHMMNDPKVIQLSAAQQRAYVTSKYSAIFDNLGLSNETRQKLITLLVEKRNISLDLAASAEAGTSSDSPDSVAAFKEIRAGIDSEIAAEIGDQDYAKFQGFEQTTESAPSVQKVQSMLASTDEPLSEVQLEKLQDTFNQIGTHVVTNKVINSARSFLTPTQLQTLIQVRDLRLLQQRYQQESGSHIPLPVPK